MDFSVFFLYVVLLVYLNYVTNGFKSSTVILSFFGLRVGGSKEKKVVLYYFKSKLCAASSRYYLRTHTNILNMNNNSDTYLEKNKKKQKNIYLKINAFFFNEKGTKSIYFFSMM